MTISRILTIEPFYAEMNTLMDAMTTLTIVACGSAAMFLDSDYPVLVMPSVRIFSMLGYRYKAEVDSEKSLNRGVALLVFTFIFDLILLVLMHKYMSVLVWAVTDTCYIFLASNLRVYEQNRSNNVKQIDPARTTCERITISTS